MAELPNIVLVHGAWADGSCWSDVIERLQADAYNVTAAQLPESSLADDVAKVRHVLNRQDGPTVLVGHSYGGHVITSLGTDAPNVVGLVYIAAFGLDEGESIGALLQQGPPTPATANLEVDSDGFAWIPEDDFVGHFAGDIDPARAKVMYAVQQPLSMSVFDEVMDTPAWKSLPSWYLVAANDEAIPPDAERQFAERMGADTANVVGLVYVAAFGLDEGESIGGLLAQGEPTPALAHLRIDDQGFTWLPEDDFVGHFAADMDPADARVMYAVQQPLAASTLGDVMGVPAWKSLPTWYVVAQNDEAIPPDAERLFAQRMGATVIEIAASHVVMTSHPGEVAAFIQTAIDAV